MFSPPRFFLFFRHIPPPALGLSNRWLALIWDRLLANACLGFAILPANHAAREARLAGIQVCGEKITPHISTVDRAGQPALVERRDFLNYKDRFSSKRVFFCKYWFIPHYALMSSLNGKKRDADFRQMRRKPNGNESVNPLFLMP